MMPLFIYTEQRNDVTSNTAMSEFSVAFFYIRVEQQFEKME